jgi:hypothetical protein
LTNHPMTTLAVVLVTALIVALNGFLLVQLLVGR